jgi:hypothetical protein
MRGGRYDSDKDITSITGAPGKGSLQDITITSMQGERAIIDGTVELKLKWALQPQSECIYESEPITGVVPWQLLVGPTAVSPPPVPGVDTNLTILTPARWPNSKLSDLSVFSGELPGAFAFTGKASSSSTGVIIDEGSQKSSKYPSLADSGHDMTGAIAVLPLGTMGMITTGVKV